VILALLLVVNAAQLGRLWSGGRAAAVYLSNQCEMIARYLWLAIWPRDLVLDYGLPRPLSFSDVLPQAALVVGFAIATVIALVRGRDRFSSRPGFHHALPTSSFVPIATEVGAERRMYLPLMAWSVGVIAVGLFWQRKAASHHGKAPGSPQSKRAGLDGPPDIAGWYRRRCLFVAGAGTMLRNREYRSSLSIARTIVG
jgi:hypothetical protein